MSVDLIKSISIDPIRKTVRVTSACNNVTPRTYDAWDPLKGGHFTFDTWLDALASDCFGGSAQFLPSCESKAHEAYLVACEKMGGDWRYAYNAFGSFDDGRYEAFKQGWMNIFIDFVLTGTRDTRKFHMTRRGQTVNVYVRRSQHGGVTGHYRYTASPKKVSWIRQQVIRTNFGEFDSVEAK